MHEKNYLSIAKKSYHRGLTLGKTNPGCQVEFGNLICLSLILSKNRRTKNKILCANIWKVPIKIKI